MVDSEGNIFKISKDANLFKTESSADKSASPGKSASSDNIISQENDFDNTFAKNNSSPADVIKNAIPELSEMENVTSITGNEFEGSDASVADRVIDFFSTHNNKIKRKDFGSISIGQ